MKPLPYTADIGLNLPCNRELDGLLSADPDGNPSAFLSCQSDGYGASGYWERKVCPGGMIFDFINQQCRERKYRKQPMLNIAILNNSCAHGEMCIGGTVCDQERLRCLCPYGTVPQLDTLSCAKAQGSFFQENFNFNSFGNADKSPAPGSFIPNPTPTSQAPNFFGPSSFSFAPIFRKENGPNVINTDGRDGQHFGTHSNAGNDGSEYSAPSTGERFGANNGGQWSGAVPPAQGTSENARGGFHGGNGFGDLPPRPEVETQPPFIFQPNMLAATTPPPPSKMPMLAAPGKSCRNHEICTGGSICTQPIALCLCPGDLEEKDGECVLPATATIPIVKVGIGALCSELAECDHGSTCVMGRCACVAPLIQHEGRCLLRSERKEVGPGELCENGEICVRGSVCDSLIPVCVCPPNTDLSDGDCVAITSGPRPKVGQVPTYVPEVMRPSSLHPYTPPATPSSVPSPVFVPSTTPPAPVYTQPTTQPPPPPTRPVQPMQPFSQTPYRGQYVSSQGNNERPHTTYTAPQATYKYNYQTTAPPGVRPSGKPNHMKISLEFLGGSKQSGVGVACSLNTDCMIGAYCNGNTNPPSCQCLSTHVNVEGRCERVIYPGQVGCRSDLQCTAAYTGTSCVDRVNFVSEKANPNERCEVLGGLPKCANDYFCINNVCLCLFPHYLHDGFCSINTTHTPLVTTCEPACEPPRICQNNRCICVDGVACAVSDVSRRRRRHVDQSMVCWPGAAQCSAGNGVCIDNVCLCINGYVEVDGVCTPETAQLNEKCDLNKATPRCVEGTICVNGFCKCAESGGCGERLVTGPRLTDGRCSSDRQCFDGRCVAGRCQCNDGFSLQSGVCVSQIGAFKNINGQCSGNDRCSGGSTCLAHVCQCVDGSSERHGRCHQSPGGRCTYGETCDGGSSCEFGLCRCSDGHIIDSAKCVVGTAEPGKTCQNGQKCVHGSVCRFGMCMCVAKYMVSKGRCVRREHVLTPTSTPRPTTPIKVGAVKGPGFLCHEKDLCSGGSKCKEGFCVCDELEVIINEQCVGSHEKANEIVDKLLVAAPGQPCQPRTNCTGGSVCINRTCTCENGVIDESGICSEAKKEKEYGFSNAAPTKKPVDQFSPGSPCALTLECPYRTECIRGVCRCKKGETIVDNMCRKAIHQVFPGGKCDPRKGYDCIGEAHCIYGVCTCTRYLVSSGKECSTVGEMEMVLPGKRCGPGQLCSGGARCTDGVCRCPIDEVPDVNKKCVKKSQVYPVYNKYPGPLATTPAYQQPVTVDFTTTASAIIATASSPPLDTIGELEAFEALLKANPGLAAFDTKAAQTIFGHICNGRNDCPANSFCFEQLCRCMAGFRARGGYCEATSMDCVGSDPNSGKSCSFLAHPGEDCTKGQVCSYNSYCGLFSGVCECPSGMATIKQRCQRTNAAPGLACVTSKNCYGSSYCDNGLCLCRTGFELVNNYCIPSMKSFTEKNFNTPDNYPRPSSTAFNPTTVSPLSMIPLDFAKPPFNFATKPEIKAIYQHPNVQQMPPRTLSLPDSQPYSNFQIPLAQGASLKSGDVTSEAIRTSSKLKVSMPGDYCGDNSICIGNSICQKQFCCCPPNTFAENGICSIRKRMSPSYRHSNDDGPTSQEESLEERQFAAPLENCQNFEYCTGGSECLNVQGMGLVCQCPINRIFLDDECVDVPRNAKLAGIGESCQNSEICLGGSRCLQGICMCGENRHDILGICVTTARPGDDCSVGQICVDGSVCAASVKTCVCPPGRSSKLGRCVESGHPIDTLRTSNPGDECDGQSTCEDNSFCSAEGVCVCLPKFEIFKGHCVPINMMRHPGENCHPDNICSGGSECRDNLCTCPNGQLLMEGRCVRVTNEVRKKPSVRQECDVDDDCSDHYQCVDKVCVCHGSFSHCLRLVLTRAEDSCREDAHCPEHAHCTDNLCHCDDGFTMISHFCVARETRRRNIKGTKILTNIAIESTKASGPGGSCSEPNKYCVMGSVCLNGFCVCGFESIPRDGVCVTRNGNLDVGEHCSNTYRCRNGLRCVLDRCECLSDDSSCDASEPVTSPPGGSCTDARICIGGAVCREGPLDSCVGGAMCVDGLCVCPPGLQSSPQGRCEPPVTATSAPSTSSAFVLTPGSVHAAEYTYHHTNQSPDVLSRSSQSAVTHATPLLTIANTASAAASAAGDECAAIGLYCRSNTVCRNLSCQCPDDYVLHNDGCVPPHEVGRKKARGKSRHQGTPTYARPGQKCVNGETCVAGSRCNEKGICGCPPERPLLQGDECVAQPQQYRKTATPGESCDENTVCTQGSSYSCHSGQCRCQYGFIAISGHCVALPMPTTPTMKNVVLAKPLDSCDNGEQCEGGSRSVRFHHLQNLYFLNIFWGYAINNSPFSCDEDTGVCMCPPGHIVFGVQCQLPPNQPATLLQPVMTPSPTSASSFGSSSYPSSASSQTSYTQTYSSQSTTTECSDDTNCHENKICVVGRCKCKPGFVDHDGVCKPLEEIEVGERPVPVSYAKHKVETMSSERLVDHDDESIDAASSVMSVTRTPSRQETQRPRIVGPPIRRPRPKTKASSSGGAGTPGNYKAGGSGSGACPPGNEATRDDSGRLIMCNGLEPNCPPRSYCYITTGGFATEEYNCLVLRKLKYGQRCENGKDTCTFGAVCIDSVCKCGPGYALSTNGWCEPFDFKPSGKNAKNGSYGQAQKNEASPPIQIASYNNVPVVQQNFLPPITKAVQQNYPPPVAETRPVEAPRPIATWPAQYLQTTTTSSPKVIRHRFLGTKCRENDVCISGGECRDGVCQCPENLYLRDGKCLRSAQLPRAAPSQPCEQGEMCTGGSICDNDSKKCVCAADHMIVEGVCRSKASQSSQIKLVSGSGLRFNSKSIPPRPVAKLCDENACRLPDCFCSTTGRKAPGGFASNDTPQFVVLTFDDAVNGRTLPDYKELFKTVMYRNPNGCPIKGTFFVSHEWTNYDGVQWLFQQGMELASNSISHVSLEGTNANRWLNEMDGQRRIMAKFANANEEEIVGLRAPQLILGGDEQFEMMTRAGFLYDNSMSVNPGVNGEPFWPQTLDHSVPWDCYDAQCPTASFPGVWAIPLNQFFGSYLPQIDSFRRSSMIRAAIDLNTTVDQLTNMIFSNFERAYLGNRAPYVLSLNADLLQLNGRNTGMQALQRFLEEIQYRKDVYVVTLKQLIEWMRNPVPLSHISQSEAVRCSQKFSQYPAISQSTCSKPNKCMYRTPGLGSQEHQFLTCSPCPEQYPWLDNPIGEALP
ncbi:unnamed protein product [Nippostrongylus brasiliensis]|uniref:EGF-like domain-containing protein n=1 Tax=Nippostrongylus brasiliensis TaxID=27835 RepID=A0A158QZ44_NIPBR|nr:unnamed protein product [Nippostrongylus brasiliensis]